MIQFDPGVAANSDCERRISARAPLFVAARLGPKGTAEGHWLVDLSLEGAAVVTNEPRFPGTFMDVSFRLPTTGETLKLGAQVLTLQHNAADLHRFQLGLRLCRLDMNHKLTIYQFLDARRKLWEPAHYQMQTQTQVVKQSARRAQAAGMSDSLRLLLQDAYTMMEAEKISLQALPEAAAPESLSEAPMASRMAAAIS